MIPPRRAGQRPHFVEIQDKVDTQTPTGFTSAWVTVAEAWAAIEPAAATSAERLVASTTQAPATHLVTLDYDARIKAKQSVLFGTRRLHIVGPPQNVDERDVTLVLSCEERVA